MKKISLLTILMILCSLMCSTTGCKKEKKEDPPKVWPSTVTDIDGNIYKTCRIGDQLWMAENLRVAHFRNGDPIPTADSNLSLIGVIKPVYQWITKYDTALLKDLGRVYTWQAAKHSKGTCPTGWRLPDTTDVRILKNFLGDKPGDKLKAADYTYWDPYPFSHPTNETGFTAYGGGMRGSGDATWGGWKSSTYFHISYTIPLTITLRAPFSSLELIGNADNTAMHIRCIME